MQKCNRTSQNGLRNNLQGSFVGWGFCFILALVCCCLLVFYKYIKIRKLARVSRGLKHKDVKGALSENKAIAEKLN